jgi:hypothetical protein
MKISLDHRAVGGFTTESTEDTECTERRKPKGVEKEGEPQPPSLQGV